MEYLIAIALVSMVALYALIIVGCSRQPELVNKNDGFGLLLPT